MMYTGAERPQHEQADMNAITARSLIYDAA